MSDKHAPCEVCHGSVERRDEEKISSWNRRLTCSKECYLERRAREYRRRLALEAPKHPPCEDPRCGRPITRRDGESPRSFRRRKCCNEECANAARLAKRGVQVRRCAPNAAGVPGPIPSVDDFIRIHGITQCPPAFVAVSQQANRLPADAVAALRALGDAREKDAEQRAVSNNWLFGRPPQR
jgi:hypothetical protein